MSKYVYGKIGEWDGKAEPEWVITWGQRGLGYEGTAKSLAKLLNEHKEQAKDYSFTYAPYASSEKECWAVWVSTEPEFNEWGEISP